MENMKAIQPTTKVIVRVNRVVTQYIDVEIPIKNRDLNRGLDRELTRIEATDLSKTIPIQEWKSSGDDYEAMLEDEF